VLEAAERLDAELLRIHHGLRDAVAWSAFDSDDAARIRASLRRAFEVTREIRQHVLDPDRDCRSVAIRASALRARCVLVAIQTSVLECAGRDVSRSAFPIARFHDVAAFRDHVLEHVGVVNARWLAADLQMTTHDDASLARILDTAETELAALGRDPDVETFLEWGASHELGVFATACRMLAMLMSGR
jgi:hypothetical protein